MWGGLASSYVKALSPLTDIFGTPDRMFLQTQAVVVTPLNCSSASLMRQGTRFRTCN